MKRLLPLLLSLLLLMSAAPAAAEAGWVNSNVIGNVTADTAARLQDDFHSAANLDWLVNTTLGAGQMQASAFTQRNDEVQAEILALLTGEEQSSHDGRLAQQFYADYMDMNARNERGMSPVMPYIEAIQGVETLDDLTAYLMREDQLANALHTASVTADAKDSANNAVTLEGSGLTLSDADEYKSMTSVGERTKQAMGEMYAKLLSRIGYAEEAAAAMVERVFAIETEMASQSLGSSDMKQPDFRTRIYNPYTVDELAALSPTFPIVKLLKPYTDRGVARFILADTGWLAKMNELYVPENVEAFKDYLLCRTLLSAVSYLDQECVDIMDEANSILAGMEYHTVLENNAYLVCSNMLGMAVGRMYTENCVSPETKREIEEIIAKSVAVYKERLSRNDWLGEETRLKAIEKLDHLRVRVAYPDDWSKYDMSDTELDGNLLNDVYAIAQHSYNKRLERATQPVDLDSWEGLYPQTVNAYYRPSDNSINILAGILGGVFYGADRSVEEKLGGIGMVIGHEITHGFDTTGSQFDKDGNLNNWWTDEDRAAFTERTEKVGEYYGAIEVLSGKFVDGQLTIGETVADLGGLSCMLELGQAYESFDYQRFFTAYAHLWREAETETVQEILLQDAHAPGYLRTNVTVQQFEAFYDAFEVKEGDGMYLAPEKRLSVW